VNVRSTRRCRAAGISDGAGGQPALTGLAAGRSNFCLGLPEIAAFYTMGSLSRANRRAVVGSGYRGRWTWMPQNRRWP
jgi:hypothetical protein